MSFNMLLLSSINLLFYICIVHNNVVSAYNNDLCDVDNNMCSNKSTSSVLDCKIKSSIFTSNECEQITFSSKKQNPHLGDLLLYNYVDQNSFNSKLNISFRDVHFKKAYLKLGISNEEKVEKTNTVACKMYTAGNNVVLPLANVVYDNCFGDNLTEGQIYTLQYKAEDRSDVLYKKFLFKVPVKQYFIDTVKLIDRHIFSYIDITSNSRLDLYIQHLPEFYNVTHYQVEVLKEKDASTTNVDIRLLVATAKDLKFEHITNSEEGYYYFKISAISKACPEDFCFKSVTPKVYIQRKGTPVVIGIVGASCIIPLVLFLFHMLTKKYKTIENIAESKDKVLLIYKQGSDKENEVVKSLVNTVEHLTGVEVWLDPVDLTKVKQKDPEKWCSDNLLLATHICYICSSEVYDLDFMTYTFLKDEIKKTIPDKDVFIIVMPYSDKNIPDFLNGCVTFNFMDEFSKFISVFKLNVRFENDESYLELLKKVRLIVSETENKNKRDLPLPTIIVTEQAENLENEPREKDGLLL